MRLSYDIRQLKANEVAGADTINPIVKFLLGMHSVSEYLTITPDGQGSVSIDLDAESLLRITSIFVQSMLKELDFSFKVTVEGGMLKVSAGHVFLPAGSVAISSRSWSATSGMVYVRLESMSTGSLELGSVSHTIQTGDGYRVTLPVATVSRSGGDWSIHYHHLGDFALAYTPYCYISGYDKSKIQGLMHDAGSDGLVWVEGQVCGQESV